MTEIWKYVDMYNFEDKDVIFSLHQIEEEIFNFENYPLKFCKFYISKWWWTFGDKILHFFLKSWFQSFDLFPEFCVGSNIFVEWFEIFSSVGPIIFLTFQFLCDEVIICPLPSVSFCLRDGNINNNSQFNLPQSTSLS